MRREERRSADHPFHPLRGWLGGPQIRNFLGLLRTFFFFVIIIKLGSLHNLIAADC